MVVAAVLVSLFAIAFAGQPTRDTFFDFFAGEWDITTYSALLDTASDPEAKPEIVEVTHYNIQKKNGSNTILEGIFAKDDTPRLVKIEMTSSTGGVWYESNDNIEPIFHEVFTFSFTNVSNGYWISWGTYYTPQADHAYEVVGEALSEFAEVKTEIAEGEAVIAEEKKPGKGTLACRLYVATLSHPAFTMTISKGNNEVEVWSAKRKLDPPQKSFLQKYGMMLIMGVFMFQMFKSRGAGAAAPGGAPAAAPAASS
ncbi:hypothetical protein Pelo_13510 [Pelomyxa schiedti]|nr:hypothetical protein Pelo_13510 [Pelomyxa schiedti]